MAGLSATAPSRSRKLPRTCGRMTSRSYSVRNGWMSGPFRIETLKWLNQKSTRTSWSCRSLDTARMIFCSMSS